MKYLVVLAALLFVPTFAVAGEYDDLKLENTQLKKQVQDLTQRVDDLLNTLNGKSRFASSRNEMDFIDRGYAWETEPQTGWVGPVRRRYISRRVGSRLEWQVVWDHKRGYFPIDIYYESNKENPYAQQEQSSDSEEE